MSTYTHSTLTMAQTLKVHIHACNYIQTRHQNNDYALRIVGVSGHGGYFSFGMDLIQYIPIMGEYNYDLLIVHNLLMLATLSVLCPLMCLSL